MNENEVEKQKQIDIDIDEENENESLMKQLNDMKAAQESMWTALQYTNKKYTEILKTSENFNIFLGA